MKISNFFWNFSLFFSIFILGGIWVQLIVDLLGSEHFSMKLRCEAETAKSHSVLLFTVV